MEQGTMVSSFINLLNTLILYLCAYIIPINKFILKKFNLIQPKTSRLPSCLFSSSLVSNLNLAHGSGTKAGGFS